MSQTDRARPILPGTSYGWPANPVSPAYPSGRLCARLANNMPQGLYRKAERRTTRNGLQDGSSPFHPPNDATAMRRVSRVVLVGRDPSAVDAA